MSFCDSDVLLKSVNCVRSTCCQQINDIQLRRLLNRLQNSRNSRRAMSDEVISKQSESVSVIRSDVRNQVQSTRLKHRHDEVDGLRIAPNELLNHSINLQTFTKEDIQNIVKTIKKSKHANPTELVKLSHAFLQSVDNIQCFLNSTGAMNVLVKELTGADTERQILAVECLCNLSLGSEIACEKVALQAGTYLHTLLQSSNEGLLRTSLWCLTNLIAAGKKPLNVLLNQEIVTGLSNVSKSCHSEKIKKEAYFGIELVIDNCDKSAFRPQDMESLSEWILSQNAPVNAEFSNIMYKFLDKLEFQCNDAASAEKVLFICFGTLVRTVDQTTDIQQSKQVAVLVRICANIVALNNGYGDTIINNWFISPQRSMHVFFNQIVKQIQENNLSVDEVYWFINNLLSSPLSHASSEYLESNEFLSKLEIVS